jgi:transcriptional regulator with XRE-family HTH domain
MPPSISTLFASPLIVGDMGKDMALRLRHARNLRGMSQAKLAKAAGVKQAAISQLETGESKSFRGTTLVSICQALKVNPAWLAEGKPPMEPGNGPQGEALPPEAERVARDWLKLTPPVRAKVASMIRTMVEVSLGDQEPAPDERVAEAYGRPGVKTKKR